MIKMKRMNQQEKKGTSLCLSNLSLHNISNTVCSLVSLQRRMSSFSMQISSVSCELQIDGSESQ